MKQHTIVLKTESSLIAFDAHAFALYVSGASVILSSGATLDVTEVYGAKNEDDAQAVLADLTDAIRKNLEHAMVEGSAYSISHLTISPPTEAAAEPDDEATEAPSDPDPLNAWQVFFSACLDIREDLQPLVGDPTRVVHATAFYGPFTLREPGRAAAVRRFSKDLARDLGMEKFRRVMSIQAWPA